MNAVTITAGVEKLTASKTGTNDVTTKVVSTSHSTAAAWPAVTQNAALLGVAAVVGGAAVLM